MFLRCLLVLTGPLFHCLGLTFHCLGHTGDMHNTVFLWLDNPGKMYYTTYRNGDTAGPGDMTSSVGDSPLSSGPSPVVVTQSGRCVPMSVVVSRNFHAVSYVRYPVVVIRIASFVFLASARVCEHGFHDSDSWSPAVPQSSPGWPMPR